MKDELINRVATDVADKSCYKRSTYNYGRVWMGAHRGAEATLTHIRAMMADERVVEAGKDAAWTVAVGVSYQNVFFSAAAAMTRQNQKNPHFRRTTMTPLERAALNANGLWVVK